MTILIYYFKTQVTRRIECESVAVGPGGVTWQNRTNIGFIGYDPANYEITIISIIS
jgi:hypothetical protein